MHYPIPTDGPVGGLLEATGRHPYRPAHIHFLVAAPGYRELTTHIFIGGQRLHRLRCRVRRQGDPGQGLHRESRTRGRPHGTASEALSGTAASTSSCTPRPRRRPPCQPVLLRSTADARELRRRLPRQAAPTKSNRLGLQRVLVLSTQFQQDLAQRDLRLTGRAQRRRLRQGRDARPHRDRARRPASSPREAGADGCIAVGGGSTTGLGKAIALRIRHCPIIAVPTTYAGSEMTPVWGLTADGREEDRPRPAGPAHAASSTTPN